MQGRLRSHFQFWLDELEPSPFVREVVLYGYRIPFIQLPDPVCYRHTKSAFAHSDFVEEAIQELVSTWCVEQHSQCPVVCSPLSVVVNHKGLYEGLNLVPQLFSKSDFSSHLT